MGDFTGGKNDKKSSQRVDVPEWMMPFVQQMTGAGQSTLGNLQRLAGRDNVADLTPDQLAAIEGLRGFAGGDDGILPTATEALLGQARGDSFLPPELMARIGGGDFNLGDSIGEARDALSFTDNPTARAALEATAGGDFLFGGEGFDAAVDAAMRKATPQIMSAFGGDASSVRSGLSETALGTAAIDAFASQFGRERGLQQGAAQFLEQMGAGDRSRFLGFGEGAANRAASGDRLLAGLLDRGQDRQQAAAQLLPGIGTMGERTLLETGGILQDQEQRELSGPMRDQMMLLQSIFQGLDLSDFLGQSGRSKERGFKFGFEL